MYLPPMSPLQQNFPYYLPNAAQYREKQALSRRSSAVGVTVISYFFLMNILSSFVLFLLMAMGLYDMSQVMGPFQGITDPLAFYLMYGLYATLSAVVPCALLVKLTHEPASRVFPIRRVGAGFTALCVVMGLGACMVANLATSLLSTNLGGIGIETTSPPTPFDNSWQSIPMFLFIMCVVPAFMEEFAYRGAMLGVLRKFGDGFAVVATAFLFGLMHGNLVQLPFAFIVGLVLGYLVVRTGSLVPSIVLHFCNNLYSCLLEIAQYNLDSFTFNLISYGSMLLLLALGLAAMFFVLKQDKDFFSLKKPEGTLTLAQRFRCFFTAPGLIAAIVVMVLYIILVMVVY